MSELNSFKHLRRTSLLKTTPLVQFQTSGMGILFSKTDFCMSIKIIFYSASFCTDMLNTRMYPPYLSSTQLNTTLMKH